MYEQVISRTEPGCIVILLDRSYSMNGNWAGAPGFTLAQGATQAVNDLLLELCVKGTKEQGGEVRHYFDVGVFGYGLDPGTGEQGVAPAWGGALKGKGIVSLPEIAHNPIAVRESRSIGESGATSRMPVWIEPAAHFQTPMCEAIARVGREVKAWAKAHEASHPPIVLNITDGAVNDSPYKDATLAQWAKRLTTVHTNDGPALLLNIFLSANQGRSVWFPTGSASLPEPGPALFEISSPVPPSMVRNAQALDVAVEPGARGLVFNADIKTLVKFLEIGTRFDVRR